MQIDTDHLHHWMNAVRMSNDPMRTLDAFWAGQIKSKEWLIEKLNEVRSCAVDQPTIEIHGGWVGVLASMLFQANLHLKSIKSIDIDPTCEETANKMNQLELQQGTFRAFTADMCTFKSDADIIINTSCEHISQAQYDIWLEGLPHDSLIILQSNNYELPEHIRTSKNLDDFKQQSHLTYIFYAGKLELPLYSRFMIVGKKK